MNLKIFSWHPILFNSCVCFVQLTDAPDLVASTVLSAYIDACIWSISEYDYQTVSETIQTFDISVEIVYIFSYRLTWFLDLLISTMSCPGQPMCGGRGNCTNSMCLCEPGYHFMSL